MSASKEFRSDLIGIGILVALIIGFGAFIFLSPEESSINSTQVRVDGSWIYLGDQDRQSEVNFSGQLNVPGYLTIHEYIAGAPGPMIAHSNIQGAGQHVARYIPLVGGTMEIGSQYVALLRADDGDEVFDLELDKVVVAEDGVVREDFRTVDELSEAAASARGGMGAVELTPVSNTEDEEQGTVFDEVTE